MTNPRLLLLDEPLEGLAPIIVQELVRVIEDLRRDTGLAVILVEQHARIALSLTDNAVILDRGRVVHRGESAALLDSPDTLHTLLIGDTRTAK
jgi:branched-chain amino acid transport system ATP-binding protein